LRQHFLYLLPLPQGHGSFLPILVIIKALEMVVGAQTVYRLR